MSYEIEMNTIRYSEVRALRKRIGFNQREFAEFFGIPLRTLEDWEAERRKMPDYLLRLMEYRVVVENLERNTREDESSCRVSIIRDPEGKQLVLINDIRFKGQQREEWDEIEDYLKEYVGKYYEIAETAERIYIGKDFPDEFAHSKDKTVLKGANAKAKANASQAVGELIQIATNKSYSIDHGKKHKQRARYGWYRYDTRLALPVYSQVGELVRYNVFLMKMLVRHDSDGRLYLYDFIRTKKEMSSPFQE